MGKPVSPGSELGCVDTLAQLQHAGWPQRVVDKHGPAMAPCQKQFTPSQGHGRSVAASGQSSVWGSIKGAHGLATARSGCRPQELLLSSASAFPNVFGLLAVITRLAPFARLSHSGQTRSMPFDMAGQNTL